VYPERLPVVNLINTGIPYCFNFSIMRVTPWRTSWDIGTSKRLAIFFNSLICCGERYKAVLILRARALGIMEDFIMVGE
jgi:hypothetical protein